MYHSSQSGRMLSVARLAFGARGYSLRILVVDDHETVRRGVCSILESRKDVEICGEAANGQDAIEKASQLTPDLIILDVTMPELDGFAAARQIRTFKPEVPIMNAHFLQRVAYSSVIERGSHSCPFVAAALQRRLPRAVGPSLFRADPEPQRFFPDTYREMVRTVRGSAERPNEPHYHPNGPARRVVDTTGQEG